MQKISPCIWYDRDALTAAELYVSAFESGGVGHVTLYLENDHSPSELAAGTPLTVRFTLCGQEFYAINGGPIFRPNPAISFFVDCESAAQMDALWNRLADGGAVLMEVDKYSFSERFGWLADRYGVSWQISFSGKKQHITPYLMFTESVCGKAEEAMKFYTGLFGDMNPFMSADSSYPHGFTFNEGISFFVFCRDQEEIDSFWNKLTDGGMEQECGWLKDRYGVSWQIVPHNIDSLCDSQDPVKAERVNAALMEMKKIDMKILQDAAE